MKAFQLVLDTVGPRPTVLGPGQTTPDGMQEYEITSNEDIYGHTVYVVDSLGVRHDYIFSVENFRTLWGYVDFTGYPLGKATLYVMVWDSVLNPSNIIGHLVAVYEKGGLEFEAYTGVETCLTSLNTESMGTALSYITRKTYSGLDQRNTGLSLEVRDTTLGVKKGGTKK